MFYRPSSAAVSSHSFQKKNVQITSNVSAEIQPNMSFGGRFYQMTWKCVSVFCRKKGKCFLKLYRRVAAEGGNRCRCAVLFFLKSYNS